MRYATLGGLEQYVGDDAYSTLEDRLDERLDGELERVERRMLAYIIPNVPACEEQAGAFARAVYAQMEYEQGDAGQQLMGIPAGVKSFSVNGFSATLGGAQSSIFSAGISPQAKAELLYAGLLYRGVSCPC